MKTDVLLERVADRHYRATGMGRFLVSGEGATREEAIANFRTAALASLPEEVEVIAVDIPLPASESVTGAAEAWSRLRGYLADEPLFDDWQEAIARRRQEADADERPE